MAQPNRFPEAILGFVSPRHRRWQTLQASLTLDPDSLPSPVPPPGPDDFVICGIPRSGTTLVAAALYQPPKIVTVSEPWDAFRLPPAELFASLRRELSHGSLSRGRLDLASLADLGVVRWVSGRGKPYEVDVARECLVGVKLPAFWRYLPYLPTTRFVVCVRNPCDVIASFAAQTGTLADGLEYDVPFNRSLNERLRGRYSDRAERRQGLYDEIAAAIAPYLTRPNVHLVRYEDWFTEPQQVMDGLAEFLGADLRAPAPRIEQPPRAPIRRSSPSAGARLLDYA